MVLYARKMDGFVPIAHADIYFNGNPQYKISGVNPYKAICFQGILDLMRAQTIIGKTLASDGKYYPSLLATPIRIEFFDDEGAQIFFVKPINAAGEVYVKYDKQDPENSYAVFDYELNYQCKPPINQFIKDGQIDEFTQNIVCFGPAWKTKEDYIMSCIKNFFNANLINLFEPVDKEVSPQEIFEEKVLSGEADEENRKEWEAIDKELNPDDEEVELTEEEEMLLQESLIDDEDPNYKEEDDDDYIDEYSMKIPDKAIEELKNTENKSVGDVLNSGEFVNALYNNVKESQEREKSNVVPIE